jgi:hypothetical protein
MELIQISFKIQWGLQAGSKYERCEPIYETDSFQNGEYFNSRATIDEKRLGDMIGSERGLQSCSDASNNASDDYN